MSVSGRIFKIMQYFENPKTGEILMTEGQIETALDKKTIKDWAWIAHDKDVFTKSDVEHEEELYQRSVKKQSEAIERGEEPNDLYVKRDWVIEGNSKPKHFHIVIRANKTLDVDTVAKWFNVPANYVSKALGKKAFYDCCQYLTHEMQPLKTLYQDEEIHSNFNYREFIGTAKAEIDIYGKQLTDEERIMLEVFNGKITLKEVREKYNLIYIKNHDKLKKLRLDYIKNSMEVPGFRMNFYICGQGGQGKHCVSMDLAHTIARSICSQYNINTPDDEVYFEVGQGSPGFLGYDGQPVIIWNDFRAYELIEFLGGRGNVFDVFDTRPTSALQNIKYDSVKLVNCVNIVNCEQDYVEFLNGLAGEYVNSKTGYKYTVEDRKQSYRRFPIILPIHYGDIETSFDILINKGVIDNTNDFYSYYAHCNMVSGLRQMQHKLMKNAEIRAIAGDKAFKPAIEATQKIKEKFTDYEFSESDLDMFERTGTYDSFGIVNVNRDGSRTYNPLCVYNRKWDEEYDDCEPIPIDKDDVYIINIDGESIAVYDEKDLLPF